MPRCSGFLFVVVVFILLIVFWISWNCGFMSDINLGKILSHYCFKWGLQGALVVRNPLANAGDIRDSGLIPGLGRSPVGGHGNPLQYPCMKNPQGQRSWQATVYGVAKSRIRPKRLSMHIVSNISFVPFSSGISITYTLCFFVVVPWIFFFLSLLFLLFCFQEFFWYIL